LIGYILAVCRIPFFSDVCIIIIANLNIILSKNNFDEKREIIVNISQFEKKILILFAGFIVIRLFMLREDHLYLDDEVYATSIQNFMNNDPFITVGVVSPYFGRIVDWYYPWGFHIWIGLFLKGAGFSEISATMLCAKSFLILFNSFSSSSYFWIISSFDSNLSFIVLVGPL